MNKAAAALLLSLCMLLFGCSASDGADTLIRPPKRSYGQQEIYSALTDSAGGGIVLRCPKNGAGASALTEADLDGDGKNEEIVFYSKKDGGSVRMNILGRKGEEWQSVGDTAVGGRILDTVCIEKLGGSGRRCVIVGCGVSDAVSKVFSVFDCSGGGIDVLLENEAYSVLSAADLDGDGENEIFAANAQSSSSAASVRVYRFGDDGSCTAADPLPLKQSCPGYERAAVGRDGSIFLDCETGSGTVMTVVLKAGADGTLSAGYDPEPSENLTMRRAAYASTDINGDGKIEIPVPRLCTGYDESSAEPVYFTSWYGAAGKKLMYLGESWYSVSEGFDFRFPEDWYGNVTAKKNTAEHTVTLCEGKDPEKGREIFTLAAVSGRDTKKFENDDDYRLLRSEGEKKYYIRINSGSSLVKDPAALMIRFSFKETE